MAAATIMATSLFGLVPNISALRWRRPSRVMEESQAIFTLEHSSLSTEQGDDRDESLRTLKHDYSGCADAELLDLATRKAQTALTSPLPRADAMVGAQTFWQGTRIFSSVSNQLVISVLFRHPTLAEDVLGAPEAGSVGRMVESNPEFASEAFATLVDAGVGAG
ncbi:hypothetical protein M427DRAFT_472182 [Gonapodya prolifera JEL478]|uniref:Uncharacterized protein n=1 Tax=Gonapodya prolifera (strain JEL478) TaxID=1344416 RepID=A0A139ARS0_GONPJ|nr:hypothetical protein M427DRAFT_472182 [Gonapodya prolifera JEL478]|eukprot:KXS19233.1 hypothetical protein M427DRAFT_472182 [Gonapodya prolifera JEL478]